MKLNKKLILVTSFVAVGIALSVTFVSKQSKASVISPISKSFSIFSFNQKKETPKKTIYGYLPYWNLDDAKYIHYDKLTDIAYFGLHIDEYGNFLTKDEDGNIHPGYNHWKNNDKLTEIISTAKKHNVNFALTIISHVDDVSNKFLDCQECWNTLKTNIVSELLAKDITDVNLNFEYVEYTPREYADKYTQLTKYLNEELDGVFGNSKVVVASFADSLVKDRVTRIQEIGLYADNIFIMAYDFHRPSSDTAGPVAPIGGKGVHAEYDIETMLQDYLAYVPPGKLILGVPYYGYNWVVQDTQKYAKRIDGNDFTGYSQSQTYAAIMETILTTRPQMQWDELSRSPYFTYTSPTTNAIREVYFDNEESLKEKYDLVTQHDLAGVGIWALGYDGGYTELWNLLDTTFIN